MSAIHEIGIAVRSRRSAIGISQTSLAKMSELSRATVNGVEQGTARDLSVLRASRLLNALGLNMAIGPVRRQRTGAASMPAFEVAARTASTSYRAALVPRDLRNILIAEPPPAAFEPHVRSLLEEAPVSLLAALVEELAENASIPPEVSWSRMRALARVLGAQRDIWL